MPLPANVTTVTVLGTFLTPEGDPSTGTITFTPSSWLTNSGANVAIPNSPTTKTLGTAGNFSVLLPITDDADLSPSGWVYNVSEVVDGVSQNYNILLPGTVAVGGTVFLADLVPAAPAGPEYYSLASSLTIGTVTTVATGGSATASITGLAPSQVLNLGIPTGATGTVASAGSGSVGTAAVAPTGDPDTGIYFPAANQVAVTTGGTQALLLAAGAVSNPTFTGVASFPDGSESAPPITNTGDTNTGVFFPADDAVGIATNGGERLRVDSSGNVGIGTTSPTARVTIVSTNNVIIRDGISDTSGVNCRLIERRARGASPSSPSAIQSGDPIFQHEGRGYGATGYSSASRVVLEAAATENWTDSAQGTRFNIATTANGGTSTSEKFRIDGNGLITGTGTSLGAWTAYTPTLGGTGWAIGDGSVVGAYCQVGKIVIARILITFGSTSTYGGSALTVTAPVTSRNTGVATSHNIRARDASLGVNYMLGSLLSTNSTTVTLYGLGASGALSVVISTVPFTWATDDQINMTLVYEAA